MWVSSATRYQMTPGVNVGWSSGPSCRSAGGAMPRADKGMGGPGRAPPGPFQPPRRIFRQRDFRTVPNGAPRALALGWEEAGLAVPTGRALGSHAHSTDSPASRRAALTDVSAPDARLGTRKLPGGPACHRNSYRYLPLTLAWNGRPFVFDEFIFILPAPMKFKQMARPVHMPDLPPERGTVHLQRE